MRKKQYELPSSIFFLNFTFQIGVHVETQKYFKTHLHVNGLLASNSSSQYVGELEGTHSEDVGAVISKHFGSKFITCSLALILPQLSINVEDAISKQLLAECVLKFALLSRFNYESPFTFNERKQNRFTTGALYLRIIFELRLQNVLHIRRIRCHLEDVVERGDSDSGIPLGIRREPVVHSVLVGTEL